MTAYSGDTAGKLDRAQEIAARLWDENTDLRARMAAALAETSLLCCACYHAPTMEHYADPCVKCRLTEYLRVHDDLARDAIAQLRAELAAS